MEVTNYPEIFQQNMNDLFHGFAFICAYIDDTLIFIKGDWTYHARKLELTLNKMKEKDLNIRLKTIFSVRLKWNI